MNNIIECSLDGHWKNEEWVELTIDLRPDRVLFYVDSELARECTHEGVLAKINMQKFCLQFASGTYALNDWEQEAVWKLATVAEKGPGLLEIKDVKVSQYKNLTEELVFYESFESDEETENLDERWCLVDQEAKITEKLLSNANSC